MPTQALWMVRLSESEPGCSNGTIGESNGFLKYDYSIAGTIRGGSQNSASGILSLAPKWLGLAVTGKLGFVLDGKSGEARFSAAGNLQGKFSSESTSEKPGTFAVHFPSALKALRLLPPFELVANLSAKVESSRASTTKGSSAGWTTSVPVGCAYAETRRRGFIGTRFRTTSSSSSPRAI